MRGYAIFSGLILLTIVAGGGQAMESTIVAKAAKPVALAAAPVTVTLRGSALAARVDALAAGRRLFLVISDLRASEQPGAGYRVYLDLPRDAKTTGRERYYAGDINFYNALIGGVGSADSRFSFDITEVARFLRKQKQLCEPTTVTFIPDGRPAAKANAVVRRVEIVEQ
ncbi:MAG: hypothetical protein QOI58_1149 [Thermoanaerobaculia bacterium]|jgi:hypothetical protein|nr:hypothetical protein [Thermoanaerobaculia bacterium]